MARTSPSMSVTITARRLFTLAVTVSILTLVPSGIANATDCAALPRPRVRLRLTVSSKQLTQAAATMRTIVDASWRPYGVTFDWADDMETSKTLEGVAAWIAVVPGTLAGSDGGDLGQVLFDHGVPRPLIRISSDAVLAWVLRQQATRFQTSTVFHNPLLVGDTASLSRRALGHVAAHEVGHFMLGQSHSALGLMSATWKRDPVMTARLLNREVLPLDSISAVALRSRLIESASCP
jgi:hypothetical protein